jgi:hypothetical protein
MKPEGARVPIKLSRRDVLRLGSIALVAGASLPLALDSFAARARSNNAKPFGSRAYRFAGKKKLDHLILKAEKNNWRSLPMGDLMGAIASELAGTPYVSYTLDKDIDHEVCTVTLDGLDCITFAETTLNLARMIKLGQNSDVALAQLVSQTRYRSGKVDGFCSRLHYMTDWIDDNVQKGIVGDITRSLPGAEKYNKKVSLMSAHSNRYAQLKKYPKLVPTIKKCEDRINARTHYYVPKASVEAAEPFLQTGDIVGITTSTSCLDSSHTGLCYRNEDGDLCFMHASSKHQLVLVDRPLHEYLASIRTDTGVIIARPLEPRLS